MKLERTYDIDEIRHVMCHPAIYECIAEDGHNPDDFKPDPYANCFVKVKVSGETIGLYALHPQNRVTLQIHAHILPKYRKDYAMESGRKILEYFLNTDYQKLMALVPDCFPNVRAFCEANGMQLEGVNRKSIMRNGKLLDRWLLGATRQEIEEFLQ